VRELIMMMPVIAKPATVFGVEVECSAVQARVLVIPKPNWESL
jgi:hypothetical protein